MVTANNNEPGPRSNRPTPVPPTWSRHHRPISAALVPPTERDGRHGPGLMCIALHPFGEPDRSASDSAATMAMAAATDASRPRSRT